MATLFALGGCGFNRLLGLTVLFEEMQQRAIRF